MSNQMDYEINKELGECYLFMGEFDKAEQYYRKASLNSPESAAPYLGLATVCVQRAELDNALVLYKKAAQLEASDKAFCGVGLVYMEQNNHEEAFSWFCKALDLDVTNIVALNCLVREAYHLERVDNILPFLEKAIEESAQGEAVHVTLAGCLMSLGRYAEAKSHLESILAQNPSNVNAKELLNSMSA